jgi:hypothetical protein
MGKTAGLRLLSHEDEAWHTALWASTISSQGSTAPQLSEAEKFRVHVTEDRRRFISAGSSQGSHTVQAGKGVVQMNAERRHSENKDPRARDHRSRAVAQEFLSVITAGSHEVQL